MFLRAARSMAAFAGMCDGGSTEDGCLAASKDDTTINALKWLHDNNYDTGKALQELVKNPIPPSYEKRWSEDDKKRFEKGYKQYGKNFFKIRRELLSDKETAELVEFYYLWKTTPSAQNIRNPPPVRRTKKSSARKSKSKQHRHTEEFLDLSSASENECESEDSDTKNLSGYACHNCYTTNSKDWHHAGKERALLCTECRLYYIKHGEPRPVDKAKTPPAFLFKNAKEEADVTSPQRRNTRRSRENTSYKPSLSPVMPSTSEIDKSRMSPSSASTSSFSSESEKHESSDAEKKSSRGKKRKCNNTAAAEDKTDETVMKSPKDKSQQKSKRTKATSEATAEAGGVAELSTSLSAQRSGDHPVKLEPKETESCISPASTVAELNENDPKAASSASDSQTSVIITSSVPNSQATSVIKQLIKAEPMEEISSSCAAELELNKEPEPKIDDTEVYRSRNAIFRRHWYRGENNSCSRTDLVFMPPPGSLIAKKREAKLNKSEATKDMKIPIRPETRIDSVPKATIRPEPTPLQSSNFWSNPLNGLISSTGVPPESPAMQRLVDISRQMSDPSAFLQGNPAFHQGWTTDPLLRYQIMNNILVPEDRERFEREIREKQQELIKQDLNLSKSLGLYPGGGQMPPGALFGDPRHWLELQQCLEGRTHFPPHMFPGGERFGAPMAQFAGPSDPAALERLNNEVLAAHRFHLERMAPVDPVARLQLDHLAAAQHHTHSHTHSHTHLHIHPGQEGSGPSKAPTGSGWPQIADSQGHFRPPGNSGSHRPGPTPFTPGLEFGLDPQRAAMLAASGLAFPPGIPGLPGSQLDPITQERLWLHQRQQMENNRRHFDREHFAALQQQQAADQQHREMMRRIQDEQRAANQPLPASVIKSNHS